MTFTYFHFHQGEDSITTKIAKNYPGRASMSPVLDLFITLLEIGKSGKALKQDLSNVISLRLILLVSGLHAHLFSTLEAI